MVGVVSYLMGLSALFINQPFREIPKSTWRSNNATQISYP
jgi:hypothetical protein